MGIKYLYGVEHFRDGKVETCGVLYSIGCEHLCDVCNVNKGDVSGDVNKVNKGDFSGNGNVIDVGKNVIDGRDVNNVNANKNNVNRRDEIGKCKYE
ncbi:hypothetical protein NAPIS_ORF01712 [Vairimorpha apis BRL 01]|uniref:Uncharacterized protein n=1 Tax=Vairimorpha apis BRL 01 TaxID=1037528 RepID=T0L870_9MICR|nr:hypothetical protein NAPIS_ORF01712 [Vairimorpha apis BRL 01]